MHLDPRQAGSSTRVTSARLHVRRPQGCWPRSPSSASAWSTSPTTPRRPRARSARSLPRSGRRPSELTLYADLIVGAALASPEGRPVARRAAEAGQRAPRPRARSTKPSEQGRSSWLATDQPDGAFDRHPLHWPLVFPEVFDPATAASTPSSATRRSWVDRSSQGRSALPTGNTLLSTIGRGVAREARDLVAYFVLRAHASAQRGGQTGLIATNTLAQGDTREVGLDQVVARGYRDSAGDQEPSHGRRSAPRWNTAPSGPVAARIGPSAERRADGMVVTRITSVAGSGLTCRAAIPKRLRANAGISLPGIECPWASGLRWSRTQAAATD